MSNTIEPWGLQLISISDQPNSGLEESIRDSFIKVNNNFNTIGRHIRYRLETNLFVYVDGVNGNDANTGLSATEAFQNLDKALAFIDILDTNGYFVSIILAEGTYKSSIAIISNRLNKIGIIGDISSPDKVIWELDYSKEYCIRTNAQTIVDIKGITFQADITTLSSVSEETSVAYLKFEGSTFTFSNCVFKTLDESFVNSSHILATNGAKGRITKSYTIAGGGRYHITLDKHSSLTYEEPSSLINIYVTQLSYFSYIYKLSNSSILTLNNKFYYNVNPSVDIAGGFYSTDLVSKVENSINLPADINNIDITGINVGDSTCATPALNLNDKTIVNSEWVNRFFLETVKPQLELLIRQATGQVVEFPFIPIGTIFPYAGTTAPNGFLLCDGTQVSKTTYAALYEVVGNNYGTSSGDLFYLPDLRGRVPQGVNTTNTNFSYSSIGTTGGAETHTMSVDQMPIHTHTILSLPHSHIISDPGHTHSILDRPHNHILYNETNPVNGDTLAGAANLGLSETNLTNYNVFTSESYTGITGTKLATSNLSVGNAELNISAALTGQSLPFNIRQPYLTIQYIIKY